MWEWWNPWEYLQPAKGPSHHNGKGDAADWIDEEQLRAYTPQEEAEIAWMPDVPALVRPHS